MKLKINIGFSIAVHAVIVIAAIVLNRGAVSRTPESSIMVSLFESMSQVVAGKPETSMVIPKTLSEIKRAPDKAVQEFKVPDKKTALTEQALSSAKDDTSIPAVSSAVSNKGTSSEMSHSHAKVLGEGGSSGKAEDRGISHASAYAMIKSAIEKARTYPVIARKKKIEGTVVAEFMITKKGLPEDIKVRTSSGSEILDSAAVAIIKKAGPMPHVEGSLIVPIKFSLTE